MLCKVLGMLCKVLGMLATSSADLSMLLQGPRSPTSKRNPPPHLLPYKLLSQGNSVPLLLWKPKMCRHALQGPRHAWQRLRPTSACLVIHYSLSFTAYKAASWGGGVSIQCGTLRTMQKHAEVGQGRCKHA